MIRGVVAGGLLLAVLVGSRGEVWAACDHCKSRERVELRVLAESYLLNPACQAELTGLLSWVDTVLVQKGERMGSKSQRGLRAIRTLGADLLREPRSGAEARRRMLEELALAVSNNQRSPVPRTLDFIEVPGVFLDHCFSPVAQGRSQAVNLAAGERSDSGRTDPGPSTFWSRVEDIHTQNLHAGYGREWLPRWADRRWDYAGPKKGYGINPGFKLKSDTGEIEVKFGEVHSEPFAARIFDALGYHADRADYVPGLEIRYDRRILTQFNSRRAIETHFLLLFIVPLYTLELQSHHDPFRHIRWARLKDGRRITGLELKKRLFIDPHRTAPEQDPGNFRVEVEREVESLVTVEANVQPKNPRIQSVGPWDFAQLDHAHRRELRGAGLLAGWLGWSDSRFDNTRVRLVERDDGVGLAHYFSDLGGGLGRSSGVFSRKGELPNEFPWRFTKSGFTSNRLACAEWFRLVDFQPIEDTASFREMTLADARWMARQIAQLTEEQLTVALIAAGWESAEVRLYVEKLVSRRDRMILDLGLEHELAPLRPSGADRQLSYDPAVEGPIRVRVAWLDSRSVSAPVGNGRVVRGEIVGRQ